MAITDNEGDPPKIFWPSLKEAYIRYYSNMPTYRSISIDASDACFSSGSMLPVKLSFFQRIGNLIDNAIYWIAEKRGIYFDEDH